MEIPAQRHGCFTGGLDKCNVTILIKMLIMLTVITTAKKALAGLTSIMMGTMVHN